MMDLRFGAGISMQGQAVQAAGEAVEQAVATLDGLNADLALLFVSPHFEDELENILAPIREKANPRTLIGCTGEAIVGPGEEAEHRPAVSVWLAALGEEVKVRSFRFEQQQFASDPPPDLGPMLGIEHDEGVWVILLADPLTFETDRLLGAINNQFAHVNVVGGQISGGSSPGEHRIVVNSEIFKAGAAGVTLAGPIHCRGLISQGCRPVGEPLVITKAEGNFIYRLGGQTAVDTLKDIYLHLPRQDQLLVQEGLMIGRAISEYREQFERSDFLIRNLLGFHAESGAIAVADRIRVGQTVQFQVRDSTMADVDLRQRLEAALADGGLGKWRPSAALLFSSASRGSRLWGKPGHDVGVLAHAVGDVPVAGIHALGAIGPMEGTNYLQANSASIMLLGEPPERT